MTNNCSIHPDDGLRVECWSCHKFKQDAALALAKAVVGYAGSVEPIRTGCEEINKLAWDYLRLAGEKSKKEEQ